MDEGEHHERCELEREGGGGARRLDLRSEARDEAHGEQGREERGEENQAEQECSHGDQAARFSVFSRATSASMESSRPLAPCAPVTETSGTMRTFFSASVWVSCITV